MMLPRVSPQMGLNYILKVESDGSLLRCVDRGWFHAEGCLLFAVMILVVAIVFCVPGVYASDINLLIVFFLVVAVLSFVRACIKSRVSTVIEVNTLTNEVTAIRNGAFGVRDSVTIPVKEAELALAEIKVLRGKMTSDRWGVVVQWRLEVLAILACSKSDTEMELALGKFSRQLGIEQVEGYFEHRCSQWPL